MNYLKPKLTDMKEVSIFLLLTCLNIGIIKEFDFSLSIRHVEMYIHTNFHGYFLTIQQRISIYKIWQGM